MRGTLPSTLATAATPRHGMGEGSEFNHSSILNLPMPVNGQLQLLEGAKEDQMEQHCYNRSSGPILYDGFLPVLLDTCVWMDPLSQKHGITELESQKVDVDRISFHPYVILSSACITVHMDSVCIAFLSKQPESPRISYRQKIAKKIAILISVMIEKLIQSICRLMSLMKGYKLVIRQFLARRLI